VRNKLADVHVGVVVDLWGVVKTYYCDWHSVLFVKHWNCYDFYNCAVIFSFY